MKKAPSGKIDDFFKLFVKREWRVLIGKRYATLWLLVLMLVATFLAISFSSASIKYLSEKMNDPFIKWVDIKNSYGEGDFIGLENALNLSENMEKYDYNSYQSDYYFSFMFFGAERNMLQYFQCRFFQDIKTDLVAAILSDDNVVDNCRIPDLFSCPDETIGIIITQKALSKLGYKQPPAFLDLCYYSEGADSLGVSLYDGKFARVPIPVLGVVKRLPSNVDIISTKYFYEQECNDNDYPFNLSCNIPYFETLRYFIPEDIDRSTFLESLEKTAEKISSVPVTIDEYSFYNPAVIPYLPGSFVSLIGQDDAPLVPQEANEINLAIEEVWKEKGVTRIFDYNFSDYQISEKSYLSVYFNKLNKVKEFESFVNEYNVKIDMSQINSKDNYNAVSIMANVLSWGLIVFAVISIILFIIDLLKSYFQRIKKNIGTFKAFGVSNKRLVNIYILIVGATILIAIILSLIITIAIQEGLSLIGILKEGTYNYLDMFTPKTAVVVLVIAASSIGTIYLVIRDLLRQTPGDLIYNRQ